MCEVPVFYATSEGQTRRIAERIAARIRERGVDAEAIEIGSRDLTGADWEDTRAVVLGASLRYGRHQASAAAFVRRHRAELSARPSAFFSVSLSAVSKNLAEVAAARQIAESFVDRAGWHPLTVGCFGGRLAYTKYGFLLRFLMRQIAKSHGGPTDTSRDHEYTNWDEVLRLADTVADVVLESRSHAWPAEAAV